VDIAKGIVGAWKLLAVTSIDSSGATSEPFGPGPSGAIIFTGDGQFSLLQCRSDLPRLADNDRRKLQPDEAVMLARGSIAYYGTYTVDEAANSLSVSIKASTFPNLIGPPQQRIITMLTADELHFTNPRTPAGITLLTVWRR
jgi:lipocalin-like protein